MMAVVKVSKQTAGQRRPNRPLLLKLSVAVGVLGLLSIPLSFLPVEYDGCVDQNGGQLHREAVYNYFNPFAPDRVSWVPNIPGPSGLAYACVIPNDYIYHHRTFYLVGTVFMVLASVLYWVVAVRLSRFPWVRYRLIYGLGAAILFIVVLFGLWFTLSLWESITWGIMEERWGSKW
ncbi:MAG: hypothetical protein G01um101431_447 [Parcubacteria group bacterium Gr01-1014_31]|nr:MAG: hypothetical protein G01um101431_447 [Parcubacteria group bacterium Gr01-1014_31]